MVFQTWFHFLIGHKWQLPRLCKNSVFCNSQEFSSWCNCSFRGKPLCSPRWMSLHCASWEFVQTPYWIQKQVSSLSVVLQPEPCVLLFSFAVWMQPYVHTASLVAALELTPPPTAQGSPHHTLSVGADETCAMESLIYWLEPVRG